jgi:hypothetical protein
VSPRAELLPRRWDGARWGRVIPVFASAFLVLVGRMTDGLVVPHRGTVAVSVSVLHKPSRWPCARIATAVISTVVLLTAVLPASGATGFDRAIPRCPAARAHVLLADAQATIYTIRERRFERTEGRREVLPIIATRGCNVSNGHSFRLDWEFAQAGSAESGSPIPRT